MRFRSCDFFFFFFWPFIFHAKCSLPQSLLLSLGLTEWLVKTSRNERVTLNLKTAWEQTASLLGVELRYHTEDVAEMGENLFTFEGKESVPRGLEPVSVNESPSEGLSMQWGKADFRNHPLSSDLSQMLTWLIDQQQFLSTQGTVTAHITCLTQGLTLGTWWGSCCPS